MNQNNELTHYGVVGMKWGVHRSALKQKGISRLERKAFNYDKKSANFTKKSEKRHAKYDLEGSNRKAIKAAKLSEKAAKARMKIAKNKAYIEMTKRKVNSLSGEELQKGKEYIAKLNIE